MKVYLLIEKWFISDLGENGVEINIYYDKEKAIEMMEKRQQEILIDEDFEDLDTHEKMDNKLGYKNYEKNNSGHNYTDIYIEEKEIN